MVTVRDPEFTQFKNPIKSEVENIKVRGSSKSTLVIKELSLSTITGTI